MKRLTLVCLFAAAVLSTGCRRGPSIEDVPIDDIAVSKPTAYEVEPKPEPVLDTSGVYRVAPQRCFGAVIPVGLQDFEADDDVCRFTVPGMMTGDVESFLDKYYPYQERQYFPRVSVFELHAKLKPEFADDAIIPGFDADVEKPTEDSAFEIRVSWDKSKLVYRWTIQNPFVRHMQEATNDEVIAAPSDDLPLPSNDGDAAFGAGPSNDRDAQPDFPQDDSGPDADDSGLDADGLPSIPSDPPPRGGSRANPGAPTPTRAAPPVDPNAIR